MHDQSPPICESLLHFEAGAGKQGFVRVAGVDEAGRGPLAGPVVAAAVILPRGVRLPAVADSKVLSAAQREDLNVQIRHLPGVGIAVARVEAERIDRINILRATHEAMRAALDQLDPPPDFALIDGRPVPLLPVPSRAIVKGDARSASIAAASIVAKVARDRIMRLYDAEFPGYAFAAHKGYGTRAHLEALGRLGPCAIHRRSFAPVAKLVDGRFTQPELGFPKPR